MDIPAANFRPLFQTGVISVLRSHCRLPAAGRSWRPDVVAHATEIANAVVAGYIGRRSPPFRRPPAAHRIPSPAFEVPGRSGIQPADSEASP